MVILVDDEDDGEGEREQAPRYMGSASRLGSNYTAEALPWDENRQRANSSDVSTSIGSDAGDSKRADEIGRPMPRRPSISVELRGVEIRPTSQDSTFVPIQKSLQPKMKVVGRPSFDGDVGRRVPKIYVPGQPGVETETAIDGRPLRKRAYKSSFSPYGVLFED